MKIKILTFTALSLLLGELVALSLIATPVGAQTVGLDVNASTTVQAGGRIRPPRSGTTTAQRDSRMISRGDTEITNRIDALTKLSTRIEGMKLVSDSEKATLSAEIQTQITNLTTLKAKIDADTDTATIKTDDQSITAAYRIYALILPQGEILAAADRIDTIVSDMTTISAKLQIRITAAQSAGKDVTSLNTALTDLNSKVADAQTQATAAVAKVSSLVPDQGNETVAVANHTALLAARADIKVGTQDLQVARKDAQTIVDGLKAFHLNASVTASTTVSQ